MNQLGFAQVTIASDGLNGVAGILTVSGGAYYNANTAATDRPASSPEFSEGTKSYGASNGTATLTSSNINTVGYTGISMSIDLGAFSITSGANGLDASDIVTVEVSVNGGGTFTQYAEVDGNTNACWSFAGGTASATTAYPTVLAAVAPAGGGLRTVDGYGNIVITNLPAIANLQIRIKMTNNATAELWCVDNFIVTGTLAGPVSTLSSANPSVAAGTVAQGSFQNDINDFSTSIAGGNMTINTVNFSTAAGTYVAADLTRFQLWYSTTNSLASATQIGTDIVAGLGNGAHSFTGLTQVISTGTTGYFFITADLTAGAVVGHTIISPAITSANLIFASGTSGGSAFAGGTQTVAAPVSTLASANPAVPAANVLQGSSQNLIYSFSTAITVGDMTLTTVNFTTAAGTYVATDLVQYQLWYSTTNTFASASQIGSNITLTLGNGAHAFTGLSQQIVNGTTGYFFITADIAPAAVLTHTIIVSTITPANLVFAIGTSGGLAHAGGTQTIVGPTSTLASTNPSVAAGNVAQGSVQNDINDFSTAITVGNMTINTVNFTTAGGTYVAADLTRFQLWYSTTNSLASASQIGTDIVAGLGNGAHSFTGLTQVINVGTTGYFFITADLAVGAVAGHTIISSAMTSASLVFASGTSAGSAFIGGTQTVVVPVSTLASANPAVPAGNVGQSSTQNVIYSFSTAITVGDMTINAVNFTTAAGTYVAADLSQFQLWYSTTNTFASASQIGSNITTTLGNGAHSFSGLSQLISMGTTGYFFVTADLTAGAVVGHTIIVSTITPANLTFAAGTSGGLAHVGGTQTVIAAVCTTSLPFTETFESGWTIASTLINTCAWSSAIGGGGDANDQWQMVNYTTGWGGAASGKYAPAGANSTSQSARFHSYLAQPGTTGDLITPLLDCSAAGAKTMTFYHINTDGSDVLDVYLSTNGGTSYGASLLTLGTDAVWTKYTVSLPTATTNKCLIKFTATSDYGNTDIGIDEINLTAPGATSILASSNPAVAAGNVAQSSTTNQVYAFSTAVSGGNMTINTVNFTTATGTYVAADLTKFQLWYSTTNTFASAALIGSSITLTLGNGAHAFTGLTQVISSGTTGYFFITADIAANPTSTVGHTIIVSAITPANLTFAAGTSSGSAHVGGTQTIVAPLCTVSLPFSENFDAAWTVPSTLINTTCAWTSVGTGDKQWQRNDDVTGWSSGSGAYSPVYTSASHSARFHNYDAPNNSTGDLITPQIDFSPAGAKTLSFQYINADASTLDVYLSTDGGSTYGASLGTFSTTSGWQLETVALGSSTSATCKVKFRGTSNYGLYDMGIDDVSIAAPPAGAPTVQATNLTFSVVDCESVTVSWTKGNGASRYCTMNIPNSFTNPTDGVSAATPSTFWANAGEQVVSDGTATSVTVTGLAPATQYFFKVFEYNGSGVSSKYDIGVGANNPKQSIVTSSLVAAPTTSANTAASSATTCAQTTISWNNGNGANRIVVAKLGSAVAGTPANASGYTANSVFGIGSSIAAGEFVVYSGSGSSVTVTSLLSTSTYYFSVFEYNGGVGCESFKTTAPPTCTAVTSSCATQIPYMTAGNINACGGSCGSEGANEILWFTSGSYAIPVVASNITVYYGSVYPPTKNYTGSITSDATITSKLNAAAGCAGVFIDAVAAGSIPANSTFFLTSDNYCDGAYDFSALCASGFGPIYVVYVNAAAWVQVPGSPSGNYANSASASSPIRYMRTDFSPVTGGGVTGITDYSFYPNSLVCNCDGAAVTWGPTGGSPLQYVSPNSCTLPLTILPVELTSFTGKREVERVDLKWVVASETNNNFFTLERANENGEFHFIGTVKGAGTSSMTNTYNYVDDGAPRHLCYYRLSQTDYNGTTKTFPPIVINGLNDFAVERVFPNPANDELNVSLSQDGGSDVTIAVMDMVGHCVYKSNRHLESSSNLIQISLSELPKGMYMLMINGSYRTYQNKFVKQ
jgi:hypothetical protein